MIKFNDWLQAKEATAFTRWRHEAALGLKPPISPAAVNSHSTASPFEVKKLAGKKKKKKKKKISEGRRPDPVLHKEIDVWLAEIEKLKKTFDDLKNNLKKKKKIQSKEKPSEEEIQSKEKEKEKGELSSQEKEIQAKGKEEKQVDKGVLKKKNNE